MSSDFRWKSIPPAMQWMALVCLLLFVGDTRGQQPAAPVVQHLRFLDSGTGFSIFPDDVSIRDVASRQLVHRVTREQAARVQQQAFAHGRLEVTLSAGTYEFEITARNYRSSRAIVVSSENEPRAIDFYLDPIVPPEETRADRLRPLFRADAMLLAGFVSDEETGGPLDKVRVSISGITNATVTNKRGFFTLQVPLPKNASEVAAADIWFEKVGFVTETHRHVELLPNTDWVIRVRLAPGQGSKEVDEQRKRGGTRSTEAGDPLSPDKTKACPAQAQQAPIVFLQTSPVDLQQAVPPNVPGTIRVGRTCYCTTCTTVEVHSLESYTKRVLLAEWFSCWGSLSGGMNSLQAGAVAIRSYATYHQQHPLNASYDICDNTCCQAFGTATSSNADAATDTTASAVLENMAGDIARTEYSAENNDKGCGDCSTGICIFDPVCCGFAGNGHGRGMCQYGSARWATGSRITTASPCQLGQVLSYGTKDWRAILQQYYPDLNIAQGATLQVGDRVRSAQAIEVRNNAGNACGTTTCTQNPACPTCLICSAQSGSFGTVVGGPLQIADLTWWQIAWDNGSVPCADGTTGWSSENFLQAASSSISVNPDAATLYFTGTIGQATPLVHGVMLREANRRAEAWSASSNAMWLSLVATTGTTPELLRTNVNFSGLAAGTHAATVQVVSPTGAFPAFSINVQLVLHEGLVGNVERALTATQRRVDGYDLLRMARAFGSDPTKANWDAAVNLVDADRNGNGVIEAFEMVIDSADVAELVRNFGRSN